MRIKRASLIISSCILAMAMLLTACGGGSSSKGNETSGRAADTAAVSADTTNAAPAETIDPLGKYDQTVEATSCRVFAPWMQLDPGEDENNNWWTRAYLEHLNIKLTMAWTAADFGPLFDEKFNISLASNSLPDIIPCYTSLAVRAIQNDKVWDMTEIFEKWASP